MEYAPVIFAILLVDFVALISPGPNFVLVTSSAVAQSRKHALWTALGISTGSLVWAGAAAMGIASLLQALPLLGTALKIIGALYLIYLGVQLLRSDGFQPGRGQETRSAQGSFWRGLLVNMTNPKSAAYYASVFAVFLTPDMPVWVLMVLVAGIAALSLGWHVLLALGFSAGPGKARYLAVSKYVDRACGGVLIMLGLKLAWDSR